MIEVLVVEDSPVVRKFLVHLLSSDPGIKVTGIATNGEEAIEAVKKKRFDIITMDISMPKMGGFEATRKIMETKPTPIVIVSGTVDTGEVKTTFKAVEAGALAILPRPSGIGHPLHKEETDKLIQTVKLMSEIKVVRRFPRHKEKASVVAGQKIKVHGSPAEIKVIAIGASTGGPIVIQRILSDLPVDIAVPVLIVQHMTSGFIHGFAEWLTQSTGFPVIIPADSDEILPGHVYIAPDGFQMGIEHRNRISLRKDEPENGLRPSVSYLFRSVAEVYGRNALGVLLTGMGKDGAKELRLMKENGAITIAQDKNSSVVHGMPGEAIKLDAARYILPEERIASAIKKLVYN
ncbi:MAG: chemotaxis-specific protein-glutamate methyltransferase CheB [Nitrospirota bacterium]